MLMVRGLLALSRAQELAKESSSVVRLTKEFSKELVSKRSSSYAAVVVDDEPAFASGSGLPITRRVVSTVETTADDVDLEPDALLTVPRRVVSTVAV